MADNFSDFAAILAPWKDFGTVLKGELKRSIININQFLTLALGPTLAGADYQKLLKKNRDKIKKIDGEVDAALDKVKIPGGFKAMAFIVNPGMGMAVAARHAQSVVTPDAIEKFSNEYGFKDLKIGRFPIGSLVTWSAKAAAQAGGYATLNVDALSPSDADQEEMARAKWWTPIERLFLLQNPLKSPIGENTIYSKHLILEQENPKSEPEEFANFINNHKTMQQYYEIVGIPYIRAHDELITGLVDLFEQEILDISNISSAATLKEFIDAINSAQTEKFKKINTSTLMKNIEKNIQDLMGNKEEYTKFLDAAGKKESELGNEAQTKEFIAQKIYEKEFSKIRKDSIDSVQDGIEDIKDEILGDLEESEVQDLKGTVIGNQLSDIISNGLERLDKASAKIAEIK